jgi:hypothetical protein
MYNMYIQPNKVGRASKRIHGIFRKRHSLSREISLNDQASRYHSKTRLFFSDPDLDFYPDSLEVGEDQGQTPPMERPFRARNDVNAKKSKLKRCKANAAINRYYSMSIADAVRDHTSASCAKKAETMNAGGCEADEVSRTLLNRSTSTPKRICRDIGSPMRNQSSVSNYIMRLIWGVVQ